MRGGGWLPYFAKERPCELTQERGIGTLIGERSIGFEPIVSVKARRVDRTSFYSMNKMRSIIIHLRLNRSRFPLSLAAPKIVGHGTQEFILLRLHSRRRPFLEQSS